MRRFGFRNGAIGALVIVPGIVSACLWDRDSLKTEARESPDSVAVITGRFERFPPAYYEMRLKRVTAELKNNPDRLDLYDDAGVACDRLGRGTEAIEWMAKKEAILAREPDSEHQYRYHANLGTFLVHQWIREGGNQSDTSLIEEGRKHIATAIELNPEAHFGREKYQLMAMDWILSIPKYQEGDPIPVTFIDDSPGFGGYLQKDEKWQEAIEGISGLIYLGDAWQSIDVFYSLAFALNSERHSSLAYLAFLRAVELQESGRKSFIARNPGFKRELSAITLQEKGHLRKYFLKARKEADKWQSARWSYMKSKFDQGLHPDESTDFWSDFSYRGKFPKLSGRVSGDYRSRTMIATGILVLVIVGLVWAVAKFLLSEKN